MNGGTVTGTAGNCGCSCVQGWTGDNCEVGEKCTVGPNNKECANSGTIIGVLGSCGC